MKDRIIRYSFICLILVVSIMQFSMVAQADTELSNDVLAWGFRRGQNHEQAVLDNQSLKVVEKFNRNCNGKCREKIYLSNI